MPLDPLPSKWLAFGWNVFEIDGHDFSQILEVIERAKRCKGKPTMVIANTVKGKGVSFMENRDEWHSGAPNPEQWRHALEELNAL